MPNKNSSIYKKSKKNKYFLMKEEYSILTESPPLYKKDKRRKNILDEKGNPIPLTYNGKECGYYKHGIYRNRFIDYFFRVAADKNSSYNFLTPSREKYYYEDGTWDYVYRSESPLFYIIEATNKQVYRKTHGFNYCLPTKIIAGPDNLTRSIVVVDFDVPYSYELHSAILNKLGDNNLPLPNVCVINRKINPNRSMEDQNHFQLQWLLNNNEAWTSNVWTHTKKDWQRCQDYIKTYGMEMPEYDPLPVNEWDEKIRRDYLNVLRNMAIFLQEYGADLNFQGYYIKNPCPGLPTLESLWEHLNLYSTRDFEFFDRPVEEFRESLGLNEESNISQNVLDRKPKRHGTFDSENFKSSIPTLNPEEIIAEMTHPYMISYYKSNPDSFREVLLSIGSRNVWACKNIKRYAHQLISEKDRPLTYEEFVQAWLELESMTLPFNGKKTCEEEWEFSSFIKNYMKEINESYDPNKRKKKREFEKFRSFNDKDREFGQKVIAIESLRRNLRTLYLFYEEGLSRRQIRKLTGYSPNSIISYVREENLKDWLYSYKLVTRDCKRYMSPEIEELLFWLRQFREKQFEEFIYSLMERKPPIKFTNPKEGGAKVFEKRYRSRGHPYYVDLA